ncbi:MAG: hypothetical protein ACPIOQ_43790, partial [Promethearchaeia archaeon]
APTQHAATRRREQQRIAAAIEHGTLHGASKCFGVQEASTGTRAASIGRECHEGPAQGAKLVCILPWYL